MMERAKAPHIPALAVKGYISSYYRFDIGLEKDLFDYTFGNKSQNLFSLNINGPEYTGPDNS